MSIRILLADDHGIVRKGLRYLLEEESGVEVVGEAANGIEAEKLAEELRPDVIVMDIAMPLLNGIDAASRITKRAPDTRVIFLSMYSDETYLKRALSAGARGYLLKDAAEEDLPRAVRSVMAGHTFFSPQVSRALADQYLQGLARAGATDPLDQLTDRERQVLQLLAEGRSNKEVASLLDLSVYTVDTHRGNLMQKLGLHNTAEVVLFAVRNKLIQ